MFGENFFYTGLIILGVTGGYLLLLGTFWMFLRVRIRKKYQIALTNDGNVSSVYQVSLTPQTDVLNYKLSSKDGGLVEVIEEETIEADPQHLSEEDKKVEEKKPQALQKRDAPPFSERVKGASDTATKVANTSGAVASLLGMVGTLLPGSLGRNIKAQAAKARSVQTKTRTTLRAPQEANKKVDLLKSESAKLGVKQTEPDAQPGKVISETRPGSDSVVNVPSESKNVREVSITQTKQIYPGETIKLDLVVEKVKRRHSENIFFVSFHSLQKPVEDVDKKLAAVVQQIPVMYPEVPFWRYWLAPLVSLAITAGYIFLILNQVANWS